ncbi:MAG: hypothetical protein IPM57_08505 [Oligoflexia bacterium]|nr:hypothetical protein [Oligoflexia bacterium]
MHASILLSIFLIFLSPPASTYYGADTYYIGQLQYNKATFSKPDFDKILKQKSPQSIAELLNYLPKSFLKNVIAIFKSRSLQEASGKNPRILLFNEDASFVITLNGHPSQAGFEALEIMYFDFNDYKFKFYEMVFKNDLSERIKFDKNAIDRTNRTGVNPPACLGCHRMPEPRPNWGIYPTWPGVFAQSGEGIDRIIFDYKSDNYIINNEWIAFKEFVKNATQNSRYSKLKIDYKYWFDFMNSVEEKNSTVQKSVYTTSDAKDKLLLNPTNFTGHIAALNLLRLSKNIICSPSYKDNRDLLIPSHSKGFTYIAEKLNLTTAELKTEIKNINKIQEASDDLFYANIDQLSSGRTNIYSKSKFGKNEYVALLHIILSSKFNMSLSDYELSFEKGYLNFSTPFKVIEKLDSVLEHMEKTVSCP